MTFDCARSHLAIVESGGMFCHTGLREKALGDRREWLDVFSHLTAQEGTWRSSGVAECLVGDFCFEAENITDRMLVLGPLLRVQQNLARKAACCHDNVRMGYVVRRYLV